eukprot:TRINITY_DN4722_c0_g2_i1.p1 TRINITY_DN4722_c0_g2~~TRINITY_DN4722_c0_g2_i1.p1  ORF type:complete len:772 (-),score=100.61 TRINITY_DN4722_c0_g2_i1:1026-3341(-)
MASAAERLENLGKLGQQFVEGSLAALRRLPEIDQLDVLQKFHSYGAPIRNASALLMFFLRQQHHSTPTQGEQPISQQELPPTTHALVQQSLNLSASNSVMNDVPNATLSQGGHAEQSSRTFKQHPQVPSFASPTQAADNMQNPQEPCEPMSVSAPLPSPSASKDSCSCLSQTPSSQALAESLRSANSLEDIGRAEEIAHHPSAVTHALTLQSSGLAFLTLSGTRQLESRPWQVPAGWYALHVGTGQPDEASCRLIRDSGISLPSGLPTGCIVALMRLGAVLSQQSVHGNPWAVRPWCHAIEASIILTGCIPASGSRNLWVLSTELQEAVVANLPQLSSGSAGLSTGSPTKCHDQPGTQAELIESSPQSTHGPTSQQPQSQRLSLLLSCAICFSDFDASTLPCIYSCDEHSGTLCRTCMQSHIAARGPMPRCPMPNCTAELSEQDVRCCGDSAAVEAWQNAALQRAIDALPGIKVACPRADCCMVVEIEAQETGTTITCPACSFDFCSKCRMTYHFRTSCEEVQTLRLRYAEWIRRGRAAYQGKVAETDKAMSEHEFSMEASRKRYEELVKDEDFKANNCRHCPHCSRVVQKLEGCNAMRCGFDTDTRSNRQDGCGSAFDWTTAPPYRSQLGPSPKPAPLPRDLAQLDAERNVPHGQWHCDLGSGRIRGLRFRCLHCPAFDCCSSCEVFVGEAHIPDHVFELLQPTPEQVAVYRAKGEKESRGRDVLPASNSPTPARHAMFPRQRSQRARHIDAGRRGERSRSRARSSGSSA